MAGLMKGTKKLEGNCPETIANEPDNLITSDDDDEEKFEVEKIISKRLRAGETEYYLKWKNFPSEMNTWEPKEKIDDANMLVEFEALQLKRQESENVSDDEEIRSGDEPPAARWTKKAKVVERIVGERKGAKGKEYEVKWKNFKSNNNTWEPAANLEGNPLLTRYKKLKNSKLLVIEDPDYVSGKAAPYRIIGAGVHHGQVMFMGQTMGKRTATWISNKLAREICPQVLLDFYEEEFEWAGDDD